MDAYILHSVLINENITSTLEGPFSVFQSVFCGYGFEVGLGTPGLGFVEREGVSIPKSLHGEPFRQIFGVVDPPPASGCRDQEEEEKDRFLHGSSL
jgi:hypothetical protein